MDRKSLNESSMCQWRQQLSKPPCRQRRWHFPKTRTLPRETRTSCSQTLSSPPLPSMLIRSICPTSWLFCKRLRPMQRERQRRKSALITFCQGCSLRPPSKCLCMSLSFASHCPLQTPSSRIRTSTIFSSVQLLPSPLTQSHLILPLANCIMP